MHMDALTHSPLMQLRQEASVKAAKAGEKDGTSAGTQFLVVRCCKIRTNSFEFVSRGLRALAKGWQSRVVKRFDETFFVQIWCRHV